jgi:putative ABC transport system permease protein
MMILKESIVLTSFAGYVGLVLGILVLESAKTYLPENDFFKNPDVDIKLALYALLLIIFAGTLAGFFPARRAASIKPIEALKED